MELKVKSINQVVAEFKPNDDFEQALLAAVRADGVGDEELKKSGVLAPADPIKKQVNLGDLLTPHTFMNDTC